MSYYIDGRDVASNHTQSTKTKAEHREINENQKKTSSTNYPDWDFENEQTTMHQCKSVIYS